ncbi:MAG: MBL fold metallo-hydrolase [Candidatus Poribacteria bacterium]|nr:MBL fold metallo-hydrolase [Candidatus Poribacteria bacterium]
MNLRFSGGANEVGASSTPIEIEGTRLLVDAGIRMGSDQDPQLPDFPDFDKTGMPDAVLLTHAHTDHTGALPVLHNMLSVDVKIYCTPATKAITKVLLEDSANRMEREEQEEGKTPQYTLADVTEVLDRMETEMAWLEPVPICGDVTATWIPAGHILGAAMIHIQGKHESILITGDVSVTKQLTIPSLDLPSWCKPDVMVMESTYGNRRHEVSRKQEAKRLADDVAKVIAKGRKVLIPAFSVGRSQEVILILKDAMERKQIPEFPVYVDGMVRKVNDIYSDHANELQRPLRRKAEHGESLFYSDVIKKVESPDARENILAGEPCCLVASSGMLNGGISNYYASKLVSCRENLIAITGYQAEGTPGRALYDLRKQKDPENRVWFLGDKRFDVKCQVERYRLSAHADSKELLDLVEKVQPRKLFLVHGDAVARGELFKSVRKACPAVDVILPENGKVYRIEKSIGIARGRRHTMERVLSEVHAHLLKIEKKGAFQVRELVEFWFGREAITEVVVRIFKWWLSLDKKFFEPDGSSNLFRLR